MLFDSVKTWSPKSQNNEGVIRVMNEHISEGKTKIPRHSKLVVNAVSWLMPPVFVFSMFSSGFLDFTDEQEEIDSWETRDHGVMTSSGAYLIVGSGSLTVTTP